jgi:hypothetical protein
MLSFFRVPILVSVLLVITSGIIWGPAAALTVTILAVLELSLSFDNAIVNAKILERMSPKWQRIFLTIGVLIAVFGMRLVFPLLIVGITAHLTPGAALHLAIDNPKEYSKHLTEAHPSIAAFGGVFLAMVSLDWLLEKRKVRWLGVEQRIHKLGETLPSINILTTLGLLILFSFIFPQHAHEVLFAGVLGLMTYLLVSSLDNFFDAPTASMAARAGLGTFLYLEVLDASFSFDGVIGAFAITSNIFLIAIGLGIGALFIRGLTVILVRKKTLQEYIYLEHGAHWAIGVLALCLLISIGYKLPELVTGLTGIAFIAIALVQSISWKRIKNKQSA